MLQVLACGQIGAFAPSWNPLSIRVPPATHHPLPSTGGILLRFKDVIGASTVSQLLGEDTEMKKVLHSFSKVVLRQGSQARAFLKWNSWRGPICYILLKDHTSFLCPWPKCLNLGLYLRLLIFLPGILTPACASSSPVFLMMYSAYELNKHDMDMSLTKLKEMVKNREAWRVAKDRTQLSNWTTTIDRRTSAASISESPREWGKVEDG